MQIPELQAKTLLASNSDAALGPAKQMGRAKGLRPTVHKARPRQKQGARAQAFVSEETRPASRPAVDERRLAVS